MANPGNSSQITQSFKLFRIGDNGKSVDLAANYNQTRANEHKLNDNASTANFRITTNQSKLCGKPKWMFRKLRINKCNEYGSIGIFMKPNYEWDKDQTPSPLLDDDDDRNTLLLAHQIHQSSINQHADNDENDSKYPQQIGSCTNTSKLTITITNEYDHDCPWHHSYQMKQQLVDLDDYEDIPEFIPTDNQCVSVEDNEADDEYALSDNDDTSESDNDSTTSSKSGHSDLYIGSDTDDDENNEDDVKQIASKKGNLCSVQ